MRSDTRQEFILPSDAPGVSIVIQNAHLEAFGADSRKLARGGLETASLQMAPGLAVAWYPLLVRLASAGIVSIRRQALVAEFRRRTLPLLDDVRRSFRNDVLGGLRGSIPSLTRRASPMVSRMRAAARRSAPLAHNPAGRLWAKLGIPLASPPP